MAKFLIRSGGNEAKLGAPLGLYSESRSGGGMSLSASKVMRVEAALARELSTLAAILSLAYDLELPELLCGGVEKVERECRKLFELRWLLLERRQADSMLNLSAGNTGLSRMAADNGQV